MKTKKELTENHKLESVLMNQIEETKWALDLAYSNFENVTDPDLIDCCIYDLKSAQIRYKFLLEKVKESDNRS